MADAEDLHVDFLTSSPPLVRRKILSFLTIGRLLKLRSVSRLWCDIIDDYISTKTSFNLSETENGEDLFVHITERCDYILELDLSYCDWISDQLISSQIIKHHNLQSINLASDRCATFKDFPGFDLSLVEFTNKYLVSDVGIIKISESCPNLTEINLSNCLKVTNRSLAALGSNCTKLISLNLDYCSQIDNQGMETVASNNHNLRKISIQFCIKITSLALQSIAAHCSNLEVLILRGCLRVGGEGVRAIAYACPKVTCIDFEGCELIPGDVIVTCSESWKELKEINLVGCLQVNGRHISSMLQNAVCLSKIKLNFQGGYYEVLGEALMGLNKIQSLELVNSVMLDVSHLVPLARRSSVEKLMLDYGLSLTRHQPYSELFYQMTNLKSLCITNCFVVDGQSLLSLAVVCCTLEHLSLNGCEQIDDLGVTSVAKSCKHLQSVNLGGCIRITDKTLFALSENCPSLCKLNVDRCSKIIGSGLIQIATHCKDLRNLSCRDATYSKENLFTFLRKCKNLDVLDLSFCQNVDHEVIVQLRNKNLNLSRLYLDGVRNISKNSLEIFYDIKNLSVLSLKSNVNINVDALRSVHFHRLCVVHFSGEHQRCKMLC